MSKTHFRTKKEVLKILEILEIPAQEWNGSLKIGKTESKILEVNTIRDIIEKYCFVGSDGTTARISENDSDAPILVSGSAVMWGVNENQTDTFTFDNRIVIPAFNRLSHSTLRTILELWAALCILISRKFETLRCDLCPFNGYGCQWKDKKDFKPWDLFKGKTAVAIFDLPIIFTFIRSIPTIDTDNRNYLLEQIKLIFEYIRVYKLPVLFLSQKSILKAVSNDLASELDDAINSLDARAKALLDIISSNMGVTSAKLPDLVDLSGMMKNKYFTDYDLLDDWLSNIGAPTPIFNEKPAEYNNNWGGLKFHYFSWGYQELHEGKWVYFPSSWLRIGYSPILRPIIAHSITCLEMLLGKGHSISLTFAHTACNMHKELHSQLLIEHFNQERPDKYKLGINLKNINKSRFMKR